MVGATLGDIRRYIESLATDSGEYHLVCGRTGECPVPAAGLAFETRATARVAAQATEQYRAALRRYDPQLPYTNVIVCQRSVNDPADDRTESHRSGPTEVDREAAERPVANRSVIDFCHTVAGAVFEAIADSPHHEIEAAIMDTYFALAETTEQPDDLCFRLLESTAAELDVGLDADEQIDVLLSAARRLPSRPADGDPLEAALSTLQSAAVVEAYTLHTRSENSGTGNRSWDVTLEEYVLDRSAERVVTLPIVLEVFCQSPNRNLAISAAERIPSRGGSSWKMNVETGPAGQPSGLLSVTGETHR
ncbi:DUF7551 domain-containing protein [Natrarchaeobius chitinivorans]|uniref:Uncharacterized protein n=1 Tax=Natrarchaeobius chitinivorans TaxID=1679083 RepID=A0A3N6LWS1_NATCH|nr:hypothetical protein [Natrarchaeobius chitinivorans]RQG95128.1 hypothetical protein EA473_09255 [Natrarchaeobius chitinivorans]